jgi:hypothetical protein
MRAEARRVAKAGFTSERFQCASSYGWHAIVMYHVYILRSISNPTQLRIVGRDAPSDGCIPPRGTAQDMTQGNGGIPTRQASRPTTAQRR